jgi:uncharacterized protein (TIGR00375 family)
MAGLLSELDRYPFLTNSDAHSTKMIGRECNELLLKEPSFNELAMALKGLGGRTILANYGLHPQLGKYHTAFCNSCKKPIPGGEELSGSCPSCGSVKLTRGVSGRILQLADRSESMQPAGRPPYRPQVPLTFFPGVGPAKRERLFAEVGTEMEVLHRVSRERIAEVTGDPIAELIVGVREGKAFFASGSGGSYGRIVQS